MKSRIQRCAMVMAAGVVLACAGVLRAALWTGMDLDTLSQRGEVVVEGRIVGVKEEGRVQVRVTRVHKGDAVKIDDVLLVSAGTYTKPGEPLFRGRSLEIGDELFWFLARDKQDGTGEKGAENWTPILGGAKLVFNGHVAEFSQHYSNPGPVVAETEEEFVKRGQPTVDEYRKVVKASLDYVSAYEKDLKAAVQTKDAKKLVEMLQERVAITAKREWGGDMLAEEIGQALANSHDFAALDAAMKIEGLRGRSYIRQGFATREGIQYLLGKVADAKLSSAERVAHLNAMPWTELLRREDGTFIRPEHYLLNMAKWAVENANDPPLSEAFMSVVGGWAGSSASLDAASRDDLRDAMEQLKSFYPLTKDPKVQVRIEMIARDAGAAVYDSLGSKCGPIISIVSRPEDVKQGQKLVVGRDINTSVSYSYLFTDRRRHSLTSEPMLQGADGAVHAATYYSPDNDARFKAENALLRIDNVGLSSSFGCVVRPPADLPAGKYQLFIRFKEAGQVIGESHAAEVELAKP